MSTAVLTSYPKSKDHSGMRYTTPAIRAKTVPKADANRLRGTTLILLAALLLVGATPVEDPAGEVGVGVVVIERFVGEAVGSAVLTPELGLADPLPEADTLAPEADPDPDPVGAGGRLSELEMLAGPGPDPLPILLVGDPGGEEAGGEAILLGGPPGEPPPGVLDEPPPPAELGGGAAGAVSDAGVATLCP